MYENAKKIIKVYDKKVKTNDLDPIYSKYIEYASLLRRTQLNSNSTKSCYL